MMYPLKLTVGAKTNFIVTVVLHDMQGKFFTCLSATEQQTFELQVTDVAAKLPQSCKNKPVTATIKTGATLSTSTIDKNEISQLVPKNFTIEEKTLLAEAFWGVIQAYFITNPLKKNYTTTDGHDICVLSTFIGEAVIPAYNNRCTRTRDNEINEAASTLPENKCRCIADNRPDSGTRLQSNFFSSNSTKVKFQEAGNGEPEIIWLTYLGSTQVARDCWFAVFQNCDIVGGLRKKLAPFFAKDKSTWEP
jgi:hypothetical protein